MQMLPAKQPETSMAKIASDGDSNRWRNGSASDSSPEGYEFNSHAVHRKSPQAIVLFALDHDASCDAC